MTDPNIYVISATNDATGRRQAVIKFKNWHSSDDALRGSENHPDGFIILPDLPIQAHPDIIPTPKYDTSKQKELLSDMVQNNPHLSDAAKDWIRSVVEKGKFPEAEQNHAAVQKSLC